MADGTFAVLWLLLGLADVADADRGATEPRLVLSAGEVLERRADAVSELYMRHDLGRSIGPYRAAMGVSVTAAGETWLGIGGTYALPLPGRRFYAELHFMPGIYLPNGGFDLGGPIAFRSGIEIGYESPEGWRYGIAYDHRSNGGLHDRNPGIETVQYRVALPLR